MPRDLFPASPPPPPTVASPESKTPDNDDFGKQVQNALHMGDDYDDDEDYTTLAIHPGESPPLLHHLRNANRFNRVVDRDQICPYVQTLSLADLESCLTLEEAIFPPQERCSKERFLYRLSACPELCLGLFTTFDSPPSIPKPDGESSPVSTYNVARPSDSFSPQRKQTLIGMVIATKSASMTVTDGSMKSPKSFIPTFPPSLSKYNNAATPSDPPPLDAQDGDEILGTDPHGRSLLVHTFGILPPFQGKGYGRVLMRAYQQRMESCGIADRISLIVHENPLVDMYQSMGFQKGEGKSEVRFGGGGWIDMIYEFSEHRIGS